QMPDHWRAEFLLYLPKSKVLGDDVGSKKFGCLPRIKFQCGRNALDLETKALLLHLRQCRLPIEPVLQTHRFLYRREVCVCDCPRKRKHDDHHDRPRGSADRKRYRSDKTQKNETADKYQRKIRRPWMYVDRLFFDVFSH